jgi:hypothetical protein
MRGFCRTITKLVEEAGVLLVTVVDDDDDEDGRRDRFVDVFILLL